MTRPRSPKHRKFIRALPCCVCGAGNLTEAAHISHGGNKGVALKTGDDRIVPLCFWCHRRQHQRPEIEFWEGRIEQAIDLAESLFAASGDEKTGLALILKFMMVR